MRHINIQQGSNIEIVSSPIIQALYRAVSAVDFESGTLEGNLQSEHATEKAVNYLLGNGANSQRRFPNLSINVTGGLYISFDDPQTESAILATGWGDVEGITIQQAAAITHAQFRYTLRGNTDITSFDEFQYFTGIVSPPDAMFDGCTSLQSTVLPNTLAYISTAMFWGNISLTEISIPASVTGIYAQAFMNCSALQTVAFENQSYTEFTISGSSVFKGSGIQSITLPDCTTMGSDANAVFQGCSNLQSFTIPSGWTKICTQCFDNSGLQSITIPSTITEIGQNAFSRCSSLSTVTFASGSTLTTIGGWAFEKANIQTITIPASVTSIGQNCFLDCSRLHTMIFQSTTPPTVTGDIVTSNVNSTDIYVPDSAVNTYKAAAGFSNFASYIHSINDYNPS